MHMPLPVITTLRLALFEDDPTNNVMTAEGEGV
jgi:hypothetical protein